MMQTIKPVLRRGIPMSPGPSSPKRMISPKRKLTSARVNNGATSSGAYAQNHAAAAAAAAACFMYTMGREQVQDDLRRTKTEGALFSKSKLSLVNDIAQEAKMTLIRSCTSSNILPASKSHISFLGLDFSKITASKAHQIIEQLHAGKILDGASLVALSNAATMAFKSESTVLDLRKAGDNITVVGDVHGSLPCLKRVMELVGRLDAGGVVVVAGDYVDRGEHSLEVFCTFLLLKLAYPKNVFLLRGNHEDNEICSDYGFLDELREKYGYKTSDDGIWDALSDVFSSLPLAAKTQTSLILHGGLPSADFNLSDLEAIDSETRFSLKTLTEAKTAQEKLIEGILWSDPTSKNGTSPNDRGYGIEFGPDVAKSFLDRHNLKYIIRAHEHVEEGSQVLDCGAGKGVVTVFSTANYPYGEGSNSGAVLKLDQQSEFESIAFTYDDVALVQAFRYLDTKGKGSMNRDEFLAGIERVNKKLPTEEQLLHAEALYEALDQGKGAIDLDSFTRAFQTAL